MRAVRAAWGEPPASVRAEAGFFLPCSAGCPHVDAPPTLPTTAREPRRPGAAVRRAAACHRLRHDPLGGGGPGAVGSRTDHLRCQASTAGLAARAGTGRRPAGGAAHAAFLPAARPVDQGAGPGRRLPRHERHRVRAGAACRQDGRAGRRRTTEFRVGPGLRSSRHGMAHRATADRVVSASFHRGRGATRQPFVGRGRKRPGDRAATAAAACRAGGAIGPVGASAAPGLHVR